MLTGTMNFFLPSADSEDFSDFYISYNPNTQIKGAFNYLSGDTKSETALVKDGKFYILNGDHRAAYETLIDEGFEACKKYFDEHPELKSSWSN